MQRDNATMLAVAGVVTITVGVIASSIFTGQALDTETVKMAITGLIGFAAGGYIGSTTLKPTDKVE